jgi:hypothetical protein
MVQVSLKFACKAEVVYPTVPQYMGKVVAILPELLSSFETGSRINLSLVADHFKVKC